MPKRVRNLSSWSICNLFYNHTFSIFPIFGIGYFIPTSLWDAYVEPPAPKPHENPCVPSPCGPNSQCRVIGETAVCSCLPNYSGRAPNCRPECTINSECPANLACINEKCGDPCPGACGLFAQCSVTNHRPICTCPLGYSGDPFSNCVEIRSKIDWFCSRTVFT